MVHGDPLGDLNDSYVKYPDFLGAVVRRNEKDLAEWVSRAEPYYAQIGGEFIKSPAQFIFEPYGSRIFLGHMEDRTSWMKYAGQNVVRFFVDEAAQIKEYELYERSVLGVCRSPNSGMLAQILLAANADGPGLQWLVDRFCEPKDRDDRPVIDQGTGEPYRVDLDFGEPAHPLSTRAGRVIVEIVENPLYKEMLAAGERNPPKTMQTERQWIELPISDNPYALYDKRYIATMASIRDEKLRRAYLKGDYRSLRGSYFDNFSRDKHVVRGYPLQSWWKAHGSLDWGFKHDSAALWVKRNPAGQLIVYKEFSVSGVDPAEVGAELARMSLPEVQSQGSITFHVSHDLFHEKIGEFTWADLVSYGIRKILGKDSCYVPDLLIADLKEKARLSGKIWDEDAEEKIRYRQGKGIVLRRAPAARAVGFMHIRSLFRTEPLLDLEGPERPDLETAQRIFLEQGQEAWERYMSLFQRVDETLPGLLISDQCPKLIEAIPKARHAEPPDDPEDVDRTHFHGMDILDSLRYLTSGIRNEKPAAEPDEVYRNRRIEQARQKNPNLTTQDLVWINRTIEDELADREQQGFNWSRAARASRVLADRGPG